MRVWIVVGAVVVVVAAVGAGGAYAFRQAEHNALIATTSAAKRRLQFYLDDESSTDVTKVTDLKLVSMGQHQYTGTAIVFVLGDHPSVVNLTVQAGNGDVVLELPTDQQAKITETIREEVSALATGKADVIFEPRFAPILSHFSNDDIATFKSRMTVPEDVEDAGSYVMGVGCQAGACNTDEGAWMIEKTTGHLTGLMFHIELTPKAAKPITVHADLLGRPAGRNDIPPPLQAWFDHETTMYTAIYDALHDMAPS